MNLKTRARERGRQAVGGWQSFWFGNELAYTLGIVRIGFGLLLIGWTYVLASDLNVAFGTDGVVPRPPSRAFTWGIFHAYPGDSAVLIGWLVLLGASIALTVGWHSRLAAIVVFILILSFERRNPVIFNSGDTVIRIEALYLALAPCGAALSMDQRRRTGSFFSAQEFRPWPLRLLQVQLTLIYVSTVIAKLAGETWQNGTAVAYSLRQHDLLIVPAPDWLTSNLLIANGLTWGTLVIELAIGILVWKRAWRPWVLGAGVILHLSISLFLEVGFFSCSMFVLYLAFIPPERAAALVKGLERRLGKLKARFVIGQSNESDEETTRAQLEPTDRPDDLDLAGASGNTRQDVNGPVTVALSNGTPRPGESTSASTPGHEASKGAGGGASDMAVRQDPTHRAVRVKLPTEIFTNRNAEPSSQRIIDVGRISGNANGHSDVGAPLLSGSRQDAVSVPLPVGPPEQPNDESTGRHARHSDKVHRNGELTGHTS